LVGSSFWLISLAYLLGFFAIALHVLNGQQTMEWSQVRKSSTFV
jgi:hypothetical protein